MTDMNSHLGNSGFCVQGFVLKATDQNFAEGIRAVVDYRGDVSIVLKDGTNLRGYVYSSDARSMDMFPRDSSRKETVLLSEVVSIEFSGEDTAKGKSWEDWMNKKTTERASIRAQPVSETTAG